MVSASPSESAHRWRALAALAIVSLLGMSTWFSGTAVVRELAPQWRLGPGATALLTIAVQLGFVAGALGSSVVNLLDIVPARAVLVASLLAAALVNAAFAFATGPGIGIPLRFLTGVCLAGVYPTGLKIMATWFRRDRGLALGIMVGALTVGSAMPHLVNALGGLPWRTVVLWTSALTALGGVLAAAAVREGPFPFPRARFDPRQSGRVLHDPAVRLACLGYFGHMWELYAMWGWFMLFYSDVLGRSGVTNPRGPAALATFMVIAVGGLGCWLAGAASDRLGRTRTAAAAMVASGACALAIGTLMHHPAAVLTLGIVWGITVVADSAQFSTMVTELADPAYVGTALTLQLAVGFTLTIATLWLVPLVRDAAGWGWAFAALAPGPALGVVAMWALARRPEATRLAGGKG
jgi:MFS family permease